MPPLQYCTPIYSGLIYRRPENVALALKKTCQSATDSLNQGVTLDVTSF